MALPLPEELLKKMIEEHGLTHLCRVVENAVFCELPKYPEEFSKFEEFLREASPGTAIGIIEKEKHRPKFTILKMNNEYLIVDSKNRVIEVFGDEKDKLVVQEVLTGNYEKKGQIAKVIWRPEGIIVVRE